MKVDSFYNLGDMGNCPVNLQALNDSMFGNTECYEGEGLEEDDLEYAPSSKRHKADSDSE